MIGPILVSVCLRTLGSPAIGWPVRAVIVLASRLASPRGGVAYSQATAMVPVR